MNKQGKPTIRQLCKRCGYIGDLIEKHHKKHKAHGGSDANPNRIYYCTHCHDYEHAKDNILQAIKAEEKRIIVLRKRLEILEQLNTPRNIRQNGYQSYFKEFPEPLKLARPPANCCVRGLGD